MSESEVILVSAPTKAGEQFIHQLKARGMPFAVVTNNKQEQRRFMEAGVGHIILLDTTEPETWVVPQYPIGKVFLFESSLPLSCRYLQITRQWTSDAVYVITLRDHPRKIYKGLGADYVIPSRTGDVSYLLS
ncbi:hypothetical protein [Paenibacillus cremeus]|uniref:Uncharacterized protein n=1 Tax=Paenibacillus cremeus TaxID=2163881 RepID=A0A559KB95_9BACL|nr:hypothetical protein [Paenibacillus cremeus]TVY09402.1 hypothetical protein FPZ49_13185 [Paenibacillus cremeus]